MTNRRRLSLQLIAAALFGSATIGQSQDSLEGIWMGQVVAPQGAAEIGFAFKRTTHGHTATMYIPDMHVYGLPLGPIGEVGSTLTIQPLDTVMKLEGEKLTGTFALGRLPMELHRRGVFGPEPPAPAAPSGPAPRWSRPLGAGV